MKIRRKYTNDEGYITLFAKHFSRCRVLYLRRVNGLVDKDVNKEATAVTYVNDYIINDLDLVKSLCKLNPKASDHEIYNWYLDIKHPVYTYH